MVKWFAPALIKQVRFRFHMHIPSHSSEVENSRNTRRGSLGSGSLFSSQDGRAQSNQPETGQMLYTGTLCHNIYRQRLIYEGRGDFCFFFFSAL